MCWWWYNFYENIVFRMYINTFQITHTYHEYLSPHAVPFVVAVVQCRSHFPVTASFESQRLVPAHWHSWARAVQRCVFSCETIVHPVAKIQRVVLFHSWCAAACGHEQRRIVSSCAAQRVLCECECECESNKRKRHSQGVSHHQFHRARTVFPCGWIWVWPEGAVSVVEFNLHGILCLILQCNANEL